MIRTQYGSFYLAVKKEGVEQSANARSGGESGLGVKAAESRGATPLASTKPKSDEPLLFQRWICRKGVVLIPKFNTISNEVVFSYA